MKIALPTTALLATKHPSLEKTRKRVDSFFSKNETVDVELEDIPNEGLIEIQPECDGPTQNAIKAIIQARSGETNIKIPNFKAAMAIMHAYLAENPIKGWIFHRDRDGMLYPYLVRRIDVNNPSRNKEEPPRLEIHGIAQNQADGRSSGRKSFWFEPSDVARKTPADVLANAKLLRETPELHAEYDQAMAHYRKAVGGEVGKALVMTGTVYKTEDHRDNHGSYENHKVVNDCKEDKTVLFEASELLGKGKANSDGDDDNQGVVPIHPVTKVFDLKLHKFFWTHTNNLQPYAFRPELVEKLVLPQSHRDILDILTHNLELFVDDIIEGKSAGNVILCKGSFGVGKTLTAEIYSEVVGRPLYSIHAGVLGTQAGEIEKNLQEIFERALRWNAVLLIDEADVFVARRGNNIQQNAVVAVFLRSLEYFKGLLFMTTNRVDDIDEAIQSRCAAIITYPSHPEGVQRDEVWKIMADNHKVKIPSDQLGKLVATYPEASPRDIKMLLRLALRVAVQRKEAFPSMETFRQSAVFRGMIPKNAEQ